jgi:hypothetical protein
MPEIVVELREPSEQGRLYYHRDPEVEKHLVYIQNLKHQKAIHWIVVTGGQAILGFNADYILKDAEFGYPPKAWPAAPSLEFPQAKREADLILRGVQLKEDQWMQPWTWQRDDRISRYVCNYDTIVNAVSDPDHSCVQFLFGISEPLGDWITLSHQCLALVDGNYLRGFFVKLADAPLRQRRFHSLPP